MTPGLHWDVDLIKKCLAQIKNEPKKKFLFTDSKDEFLLRMEIITNNALIRTKDNLRYLEQMDKIRQVREGAKIEDVYTWLKKDKEC